MASGVERILDFIIIDLLETKTSIATIVVAEMGAAGKIDLAHSLLHRRFGKKHWFHERAMLILEYYAEVVTIRNDLAHGVVIDSPNFSGEAVMQKYKSRRKKGEINVITVDISDQMLSDYSDAFATIHLCMSYLAGSLYVFEQIQENAPGNMLRSSGHEEAHIDNRLGKFNEVVPIAEIKDRIDAIRKHRRGEKVILNVKRREIL